VFLLLSSNAKNRRKIDHRDRCKTVGQAWRGEKLWRDGSDPTTAASILLRESSNDIGILIDGVEGWSASGLPLEIPDAK